MPTDGRTRSRSWAGTSRGSCWPLRFRFAIWHPIQQRCRLRLCTADGMRSRKRQPKQARRSRRCVAAALQVAGAGLEETLPALPCRRDRLPLQFLQVGKVGDAEGTADRLDVEADVVGLLFVEHFEQETA